MNYQNIINDFMIIKEPLLLNNNNINNAFNNYTQLNNRILFPEYNRLTLSPSLKKIYLIMLHLHCFEEIINRNESTIINNKLFENKSF